MSVSSCLGPRGTFAGFRFQGIGAGAFSVGLPGSVSGRVQRRSFGRGGRLFCRLCSAPGAVPQHKLLYCLGTLPLEYVFALVVCAYVYVYCLGAGCFSRYFCMHGMFKGVVLRRINPEFHMMYRSLLFFFMHVEVIR